MIDDDVRSPACSAAVSHSKSTREKELQGSASKKIMVVCTTDRLGFGDDELGMKLMINFLRTLKEMGDDLWRLVFVNNGVRLTIEESEVLQICKAMSLRGLKS